MDMICSNCGVAQGVIEVRYTAGERVRRVYLCPACAREQGIHTESVREPDATELYATLLAGGSERDRADDTDRCDFCATSWAQIRRSGEAGCAQCYAVFAADISRLLTGASKEPLHSGRLPQSLQTFRTLIVDRENLKESLRTAVESEEFERAAEIRDRLARMDKKASEAEI